LADFLFALLATAFLVGICFAWVFAIVDIFVRKDLSGIMKALWLLVIIVLPILGVLIYLIARPNSTRWWRPQGAAAGRSVSHMSGSEGLEQLRRQGVLTDREFAEIRDQAIMSGY
jgi:hypothetical protein